MKRYFILIGLIFLSILFGECLKKHKIAMDGEIIFGPMYDYNVYKINLKTLQKELFYKFEMRYDINNRFKNIRHIITGFYFGDDFIIYETLSKIYKYDLYKKTSILLCEGKDFIYMEKMNYLVYYNYKEGLKILNMNDNTHKIIEALKNFCHVVSHQIIVRSEMGNIIKIDDNRITFHNIKENTIYVYDIEKEELINTEIQIGKKDFLLTYCDYNNSLLIVTESGAFHFVNIDTTARKKIVFLSKARKFTSTRKFTYIKELEGFFFLKPTLTGLITGETNLYFWDLKTNNVIFISKRCRIGNIYYFKNGITRIY